MVAMMVAMVGAVEAAGKGVADPSLLGLVAVVTGPGLAGSTAGVAASLSITFHDNATNQTASCSSVTPAPKVLLRSLDHPDSFIAGAVQCNDTTNGGSGGAFTAQYTVNATGDYSLGVTYNGTDVAGSPFYPSIAPGPASPTHSLAYGKALVNTTAAPRAFFTVTAVDAYGNPIPSCSSSAPWTVTAFLCSSPGSCNLNVGGGVQSCSAGGYAAWFNASSAGDYQITVQYAGVAIRGSPFRPVVLL